LQAFVADRFCYILNVLKEKQRNQNFINRYFKLANKNYEIVEMLTNMNTLW